MRQIIYTKIPLTKLSANDMRDVDEDMVVDYINNTERVLYVTSRNQNINVIIIDEEVLIIETTDGMEPTININNIQPTHKNNKYYYDSSNLDNIDITLIDTNVKKIDLSNTFTIKNIKICGIDSINIDISNTKFDTVEFKNPNLVLESFIDSNIIKTLPSISLQSYLDNDIETT